MDKRALLPAVAFASLVASLTAIVALASAPAAQIAAIVGFMCSLAALVVCVLQAERTAAAREVFGERFSSFDAAWSEFERQFWSHLEQVDGMAPESD